MKTALFPAALLLLGSFAFGVTGCATEYHSIAATPAYSGTSLPAASRVALVMEFRGGEPTPEEREDVRAILTKYLTEKGSVVVGQTTEADYLVHAVLERRNPENPSEWTVVSTSSARSLGAPGGDEFEWPGGIVEVEEFETSRFSYVGFGLFYPIWFDVWDSPWYHGRIILCPPLHRPSWHARADWRHDRRWHRPQRWHDRDRHDGRRPDLDRRDRDRWKEHQRPDNRERRDPKWRDPRDGRRGERPRDPKWKPGVARPKPEPHDRPHETIRDRERVAAPTARPHDSNRFRPQPNPTPRPPEGNHFAPQPTRSLGTPAPAVRPPPSFHRDHRDRPEQVRAPRSREHRPQVPPGPPHSAGRPTGSTLRPPPAGQPPHGPRVQPAPRPRTESPAKAERVMRAGPRPQPQGARAGETMRRPEGRRSSGPDHRRGGPPPAREHPRRDAPAEQEKDRK